MASLMQERVELDADDRHGDVSLCSTSAMSYPHLSMMVLVEEVTECLDAKQLNAVTRQARHEIDIRALRSGSSALVMQMRAMKSLTDRQTRTCKERRSERMFFRRFKGE